MALSLGKTVNYVVQAQTTKTLTEVTVLRWVDRAADKKVIAWVKEIPNPIVLWDETTTPSYDAVGNWTEEQAQARLVALIGA